MSLAGKLYSCPIATATLQERCQPYLPSLDPIRGLPGLPHKDLPKEPFRYLRWYGAEHAEVFFGRNRNVRILHEWITSEDTRGVMLLYGASGVGKSSLLEAGLLPRLSWHYHVHARRRDPSKMLDLTIDELFCAARMEASVTRKPLVLVLDQIEEVFTDPMRDGNAEVAALSKGIKRILNNPERICVRIVLGFRSEWLASIRTRMNEADIAYNELHLERLVTDEIEDIVRDVASTGRLRAAYGVKVDEELPRQVAADLLADPQSPVSPILSIVLTRLWEAATQSVGERRLSKPLYDARMRGKLDLRRFLDEQIQEVASTQVEDESSGLVNDVLYQHTTEHGTAKEVSTEDLRRIYYQIEGGNSDNIDYLGKLVNALEDHWLLYGANGPTAKQRVTYLAHDTLAPLVRSRHASSNKPGQRAERILESRVSEWNSSKSGGSVLDQAALSVVEQGSRGMRGWSEAEKDLVAASKKRGDEERNRRNWQRVGAIVAVGLIAITAATAGLAFLRSKEAQKIAEQQREIALSRQLAIQSSQEVHKSILIGMLLAIEAYKFAPTFEARQNWLSSMANMPKGFRFLSRHRGRVYDIAFSPDGKVLATGSADKSVILWDVSTGELISAPLLGHAAKVLSVAFSPDGKTLATGDQKNIVRLWNIASGKPIGEPYALSHYLGDGIVRLIFSREGKLFVFGNELSTGQLLDVAKGSVESEPSVRETTVSSAFCCDGRNLVLSRDVGDGGLEMETYGYWNRATGKPWPEEVKVHGDDPSMLAISRNGETVVTGARDGTVSLWQRSTGKRIGKRLGTPLTSYLTPVPSFALSADGKTLALGSWDGTIRLWDVATGDPLSEPLKGTAGVPRNIIFSPEGLTLAAAGDDGSVLIWHMVSGTLFGEPFEGPPSETDDAPFLAFNSDGSKLAIWNFGGLILWNIANARPNGNQVLAADPGFIGKVAFSPDGKTLVASIKNKVKFWDVATGSRLENPPPNRGTPISDHDDRTMTPWDLATGKDWGKPIGVDSKLIGNLVFSRDGSTVATTDRASNTVSIWDVPSGRLLSQPLRGGSYGLQRIRLSGDGRTVAAQASYSTVKVLNSLTGKQLGEDISSSDNAEEDEFDLSNDGRVLRDGRRFRPREALGHDDGQVFSGTPGDKLGETLRI